MKRSFSFGENPVLFILKKFPEILPGIEKVVTIYHSPDSGNILAMSLKKIQEEYKLEELSLKDSLSIISRLRNETTPYTWMQKENIPFEIQIKENVQIGIFNELNNNILLIRYPSRFDHLNDLFFVYFNENRSNFGVVNTDKLLSTDNKFIIAHIVRNAINSYFSTLEEDRKLFSELQENTRTLVFEINSLRNELEATQAKYDNGFVQLCSKYLLDISKRYSRKFSFSDSAIEKLKNFDGDFNDMGEILEKAALFAESLTIDSLLSEIIIMDFHLNTSKPVKKATQEVHPENNQEVPVRYMKTLVLLDKLENAALNVKTRNKLLTSANLGNEFPTPVTPPAISDALKKHRLKIIHLFKEYPGRWEIIRNEFRPIQNILRAKTELNQRSA